MRPPGHQPPERAPYLDLIAANRSILRRCRDPVRQYFFPRISCTACRTDLFFSFRPASEPARMMAAIGYSAILVLRMIPAAILP